MIKCPNTPLIIYYQRTLKAFLLLPTTLLQLCELLTTSHDLARICFNWSNLTHFTVSSVKIKKISYTRPKSYFGLAYFFNYILKFIYKNFFLYPGKISTLWKILNPFVTEHYISFSLGLNPSFSGSMSCKLFVLSVRQQHHLVVIYKSIYFGI